MGDKGAVIVGGKSRADERLHARRFALECDCGSQNLTRFGPYADDGAAELPGGDPADPGLRWAFLCRDCGHGVRIYATSEGWRAKRVALPEGVLLDGLVDRMERAYAMGFERGRLTFQRGEELPESATSAERHGYNVEESRAHEVNEAEARGYERGRAADTSQPPPAT